ncbi:hypothetical protein Bra1253DRAFT_07190 [Bradyrhizobium sp. WSM1253]|nr:hypothetical protein Bra1253DRAFT_07190 [Bradyrhizobium sp. WSM1253]
MIRPLPLLWLWSEALHRLSRARLATLRNWKNASSLLPNVVFRVRAKEERDKVAQSGSS